MYMCVCTCTCHTGALHITCTCNKHIVLLLSRHSIKDPGQRSRIEEEFVARSKCIQSHYMYVTLPFTSILIAAKPSRAPWILFPVCICVDGSRTVLEPALIKCMLWGQPLGSQQWQLSLTLCMCDRLKAGS